MNRNRPPKEHGVACPRPEGEPSRGHGIVWQFCQLAATESLRGRQAAPLQALWLLFSRRRRPFQGSIQILNRSFAYESQDVGKFFRQKVNTPCNSVFAAN